MSDQNWEHGPRMKIPRGVVVHGSYYRGPSTRQDPVYLKKIERLAAERVKQAPR